MVIDRQTLIHYCDLIDYIADTNRQIEKIASDIKRIDRKLKAIENGEKVTDKVYGGEGGWQGFIIEGIPVPEYDQCKTALLTKRIRLNDEYKQLALHQTELCEQRAEVQRFLRASLIRTLSGLSRIGASNNCRGRKSHPKWVVAIPRTE